MFFNNYFFFRKSNLKWIEYLKKFTVPRFWNKNSLYYDFVWILSFKVQSNIMYLQTFKKIFNQFEMGSVLTCIWDGVC